jgi:acetamidase/formamidase/AraC-like DNA-binding protein
MTTSFFSTEAYPGDRRADAWKSALAPLAMKIKRLDDDGHLRASSRSVVSPLGISFSHIASSPQELSCATQRGDAGVWLALHLEGRARLEAESDVSDLVPGDIAFGSLGVPFGLAFDTDFRHLFVKVPQSVLASRLVRPFPMRIGRSSGKSGFGHVFAGMLGSIAETIEKLTPDQLRPIEIALTEFLATSLVSEVPDGTLRGATCTQTAILNRICQLIEARLGEHDFSRETVATKEGISPRYVQKLFENAGETFAHYLRLRRLERCRSELVNPIYAHLSITDICYRWGFNDSAHFSRAFRDQYGMSPRSYRKRLGGALSQSMLLQIGRGWPDASALASRQHANTDAPEARQAKRPPRRARSSGIMPASLAGGRSRATLGEPQHHYLAATDKTVHWGYFSKLLPPVLRVRSGDLVTIETLTHHANDDYERMVKGDSGAESVFHWTSRGKHIDRRGAGPPDASIFGRGAGEGFGVHLCTGPIALEGAEPGDILELRILNVRLRPSANLLYAGRAFGSNAAAWWGFHYNDLLTDPKPREVVTIYEVDCMGGDFARAAYSFRWTPQRDPFGIVHPTIDYPGIPVDHATIVENHNVLKGVRIPLRPHFGVIGVAPKEADIVDSIPPSYFGGNLDNWRAGPGATIYLPVSVPEALLSVGDPHASQGDSELCGTAIECSLTGMFQILLHKKRDLAGHPYVDLNYPLLETPKEWVIHGFSLANYLAELGDVAQSEIYKRSSLDTAMRDAFWKIRRFLMKSKGLNEDEAISLISVAADFGVTQVVDGNWCVHALLRKELFEDERHEPTDRRN